MKIERAIGKISLLAGLVWVIPLLIGAGMAAPAAGASLSSSEAETLAFMREEEKLAHDVYLMMFEKWGAAIFSNILASEQRHMDTMLKMLTRYALEDPAAGKGTGEFTNGEIQSLYYTLIAKGNQSLIDALEVGMEIENTDIIDLQDALAGTNRKNLRTAYTNLLEGSLNHQQAFEKELAAQGP